MSISFCNSTVTAPDGLQALFHPRSIAFMGASERPSTPASRGLRNCLRHGFKGGLYPINPKYGELFGSRCYASLFELPEVPDLVMISLNADLTLKAVAACRDVGVKVVVACSAGWEEQGPQGQERADKLRDLLQGSSMRLLGPNCLGAGNLVIGFSLGYNSSFESMRHQRSGRVALITQSGAMMGGLILNAEDVGAEIGLYAHVGNAMDISMEEIVEYLVDDIRVDVIALMIEGLRQPARFVTAARRARQAGKPLVVFKAGASELGQQAVLSHTGALAGSDEIFAAVCREQGILRVEECEDLIPTAAMLNACRHKAASSGDGLLVFTLSGGAASILADECATAGVPVPRLSSQTRRQLQLLLPSYVKADNPLDIGGALFSDAQLSRHAMATALQDPAVDTVLWVGVGAPRDERSRLWLDQAIDVLQESQKFGVLVSVSGYPQEEGFARARELGVPVMRSLRAAAVSIGHLHSWHRAIPEQGQPASNVPQLPTNLGVIDEVCAKSLLAQLGIPVPEARVVARADEVAACAAVLGGTVVVKGLARGVTHKSELGLVALGLDTPDAAEAVARNMVSSHPELNFIGFLVERMAPRGVEVVLGIKRDATFGPTLMFGLGGVSVELFRDVAFGTCPLSPQAARGLIAQTKASVLLRGFRGSLPADEEALVLAMVRLSQFAAHHTNSLAEMDVNPIVVLPQGQGVLALDAVIVCDTAGD